MNQSFCNTRHCTYYTKLFKAKQNENKIGNTHLATGQGLLQLSKLKQSARKALNKPRQSKSEKKISHEALQS